MNATHTQPLTDSQVSPSAQATWVMGTVVEAASDALYVSVGQRAHEAVRATSCLVAPEPGDEVALLRAADGRLFVTTVLARPREAALTLQAPHGLALVSGGDIHLTANHSVKVHGQTFLAQFDEAHWVVRLLRASGAELVLHTKVARLLAQAAEAVVGRLQLSAERSYRHISDAEHVRVGMLDVRAEQLANVRAGTLVMTARELAKVDGAQIHVG